jgi:hypothetical protein
MESKKFVVFRDRLRRDETMELLGEDELQKYFK